jgi:hypothetical protein
MTGRLQTSFHLDRGRLLVAGTVVSLEPAPALPAGGPDLGAEWPGGLSRHGAAYLCLPQPFTGSAVSEIVFEFVRRGEFGAVHSRMQSLFAMETLAEARAFRHRTGDLTVPIVRVDGVVALKANMALISWTNPPSMNLERAREYWRGDAGLATPPVWELLLRPPVVVRDVVQESEPS